MSSFKQETENGPLTAVKVFLKDITGYGKKSWLTDQQKDRLIFYGGLALGAYVVSRFLIYSWRRWEPADIVRGDDEDQDFIQDCLEWHNYYRRLHGVSQLILNKTLSANALAWATHLAAEKQMYHQPNNDFGENIFMRTSTRPFFHLSAKAAVYAWYREIEDYVLGHEPSNIDKTGHFTQLIWKTSSEVGIGQAKSRDGHVIVVVAEYWPSGNVIGKFIENVPPPL